MSTVYSKAKTAFLKKLLATAREMSVKNVVERSDEWSACVILTRGTNGLSVIVNDTGYHYEGDGKITRDFRTEDPMKPINYLLTTDERQAAREKAKTERDAKRVVEKQKETRERNQENRRIRAKIDRLLGKDLAKIRKVKGVKSKTLDYDGGYSFEKKGVTIEVTLFEEDAKNPSVDVNFDYGFKNLRALRALLAAL